MKMKDLCAQERPREKMLLCGAKSLSTAELLAILIGSGIGGKNAVDVAQELLIQAEGQLGKIAGMSPTRIAQQKGIGKVRALSITAALELGRRFFEETAGVDTRPLTSPDRVPPDAAPFQEAGPRRMLAADAQQERAADRTGDGLIRR